jgi:hypothetical protein
MKAIIAGPDRGLRTAFEEQGVEVTALDGVITREELTAAGVADADLIVVTDVGEASAVPVARRDNPDIRVVIYDGETMPDFVRGQVDLAVDPDLLDPSVVAEELSGEG